MEKQIKSKYLSLKRRYTQEALAKKIGITRAYLSQILNGRKPSDEVLEKLKRELNVQ